MTGPDITYKMHNTPLSLPVKVSTELELKKDDPPWTWAAPFHRLGDRPNRKREMREPAR